MRNEHQADTRLAQALEDLQDLDPVRGVKRAHRLVQHDQLRLGDQGAGYRHPLSLAAGKLTGETPEQLRVQANPAEERAGPGLRLSARDALDQERLDDRLRDRQIRVEAAQRVLEDVLHHAPSAQVAPLPRLGLRNILPVDDDPAP